MRNNARKLVAVGDLHGDFYRLSRILSEQSILDPETLEWKSDADWCDVILLGDYVDWRGEPLEGPYSEWTQGPRRVLEFIFKLSAQLEKMREAENFRGRFYPLLGNHDEMMLQGHRIMNRLSTAKEQPVRGFPDAETWVDTFSKMPLDVDEEQDLMRFLNWYEQGGDKTIGSFGGIHPWIEAMEGELGDFMRNLPIAVVVNQKLFCHSVPDDKACWVPAHQLNELQQADGKIREQFLWGRKVWGYDAFMGIPTRPMTEGEVDEMLEQLGVKSVVVGHTHLRKDKPYFHYGGKVINLDTHGIPGSQGLVEEYEIEEKKAAALKTVQVKKKPRAWKRLGRN